MGREARPLRGDAGSRRMAVLAALAGSLVLMLALALPSGASALVTGLSLNGGNLDVMGSDGADSLTIRFKPDGKGNPTVQIFDPQGIPDPLPTGCSRKDQFNVTCPAELFLGVDVHAGNGNDVVIFDFGLFFPFTARATSLGATYGAIVDAGPGNDNSSYIGTGPSTQVGGPGNDSLGGGSGPDNLGGGPGDDKLKGNAGPDSLNCGGGTDKGIGGPGKDKSKGCEQGRA